MRLYAPLLAAAVIATGAQADAPAAFPADAAVTSVPTFAIYDRGGIDQARAREALVSGDYARAVFLLEPLAEGADAQSQLLAGYANLGAGRIGRAELYFHRTLAKDRYNAFGRHGLGLAALARGDRTVAVAQLEQLADASRRCRNRCDRAGEIEAAFASLKRAIG